MNGSRSQITNPRRRVQGQARRGAATVEFAVAAPFLFALLLGMIDMGQMANVGQAVSGASARGAREAAKPTTDVAEAVEAHVVGYLAERFPNTAETTLSSALQVTVLDAAGNVLTGDALGAVQPGSAVTVQVVFQFDSVRWLSGIGFGQGGTLRTSTVVRRG